MCLGSNGDSSGPFYIYIHIYIFLSVCLYIHMHTYKYKYIHNYYLQISRRCVEAAAEAAVGHPPQLWFPRAVSLRLKHKIKRALVLRLTPWASSPFLVGVVSIAAAIRKLPYPILSLVSLRFEPCGRRCSVRPHTVRRPGLALVSPSRPFAPTESHTERVMNTATIRFFFFLIIVTKRTEPLSRVKGALCA